MKIDFKRFLADTSFIWHPFVKDKLEIWHGDDEIIEIVDNEKIIPDPIVSVVILSYNHREMLKECVLSVLNQETKYRFEIIIVDDVSNDGVTLNIVCELQKEYPESIRVVVGHNNVGSIRNALRGLKVCRGSFIACIDGDDFYCSTHKLERQISYLISHPEVAICTCSLYQQLEGYSWARTPLRFKTKKSHVSKNEVVGELRANEFLKACTFVPVTAFFRADSAKYAVDKITELTKIIDWFPCQDFELWYYMVQTGKMHFIPEEMCVYRTNHTSASADRNMKIAVARQFGDWCDKLAMIQNAPEYITEETKNHVERNVVEFLARYVELERCENQLSGYLKNLIKDFGPKLDLSGKGKITKIGGRLCVWSYLLRKLAIGLFRL